jgi:hypothetical protein
MVLVGGAGGMGEPHLRAISRLFREFVIPALDRWQVVVVDGGTDAGVMRLIGRERKAAHASFPLVGVAAAGTVSPSARIRPTDADIEPNHPLVLLVPGVNWGDESPWLASVATEIAAGAPSATLLINGGDIAYEDVGHSLAASRPVVVVAGSGRASDEIGAAFGGESSDERAVSLVGSTLIRISSLGAPASVTNALAQALLVDGDSPSVDST